MVGNVAVKKVETELESKWKALGRQVGELNKGDIVFYTPAGFGEVVMTDGNKVSIEFVEKGQAKQQKLLSQQVELITPAEYRFDH